MWVTLLRMGFRRFRVLRGGLCHEQNYNPLSKWIFRPPKIFIALYYLKLLHVDDSNGLEFECRGEANGATLAKKDYEIFRAFCPTPYWPVPVPVPVSN